MTRGEDGLLLLGASSLLKNVQDLKAEREGVREGADPEAVHQSRVASRRLRAGMTIFPECLPDREGRKWMKEIRSVTRALGEARDLDVQIEFLQEFDKSAGVAALPGLDTIVRLKKKAREEVQPSVVSWLEDLEEKGMLQEMELYLSGEVKRLEGTDIRGEAAHASGLEHIAARIRELLEMEGCVPRREAIEEHHDMRIAAKRLRYSAEAFRPLFDDRLKQEIATLKGLQDMLGEMHDCDVWMAEEAALSNALSSVQDAPAGLSALIEDRRGRRSRCYEAFVERWAELRSSGFFEGLEARFGDLPGAREGVREARLKELAMLAGEMDVDPAHSRKVTELALALFTELESVHGLSGEDRFILEAAGMLHDIGWVEGQEGHNRTSHRLIMEGDRLPLLDGERQLVAAVARYHRGRLPRDDDKEIRGLSGRQRDRVSRLAALLRIADGLDRDHEGTVKGITASVEGRTVTIEANGRSDLGAAAALKKANLFQEVFGLKVAVR